MLKCLFNLSVVILIERSRRGSYNVILIDRSRRGSYNVLLIDRSRRGSYNVLLIDRSRRGSYNVLLIERSRRGSYHVIFQLIKNILLLIALQHWRTWLSEPALKKALQCDSDWCVAFVEGTSSICVKVVVELQILESGTARYVHASTVDLNNILNSPNFIWIWWDFIVYKVIAS